MENSSIKLEPSMESPNPSPHPSKRVKYNVADEIADDKLHCPVSTGEHKQEVDDDQDYIDLADVDSEGDEEEVFPDLESEAIAALLGEDRDDSSGADEYAEDDWSDTVDLSSDPDVLRFEECIRAIIQKVKACALDWDTTRPWKECPFSIKWHQWWSKVSASFLLKFYLEAMPQWVRQTLGRGDLSGLSSNRQDPRIGVYIDVVTKPETVARYVGSATGTSSDRRSDRGLWSRLGDYHCCAKKGALNGPIIDSNSAHLTAIMDPINKMDLRIMAIFADGTPIPYITSLETVMVLFFGCCKTSYSVWRPEALAELVKAVRPHQVSDECEPLNGTLPSKQGCRRRAHLVDPECAWCHRTPKQRFEAGEETGCNKWRSLEVSEPDKGIICNRCASYRFLNKVLPPPHVLETSINLKQEPQRCDSCFRVQPVDETGKAIRGGTWEVVRFRQNYGRRLCEKCFRHNEKYREDPPPEEWDSTRAHPCANCGSFFGGKAWRLKDGTLRCQACAMYFRLNKRERDFANSKSRVQTHFWIPVYLSHGYMLTEEQQQVALADYEALVRRSQAAAGGLLPAPVSSSVQNPLSTASTRGPPSASNDPRSVGSRLDAHVSSYGNTAAPEQPDQTNVVPSRQRSRKRKAAD